MPTHAPRKEHYSCFCSFCGTQTANLLLALILPSRYLLVESIMKANKRPENPSYLLPESIGQMIQAARQAKGWSLRQLAEAASVGPTTIHRLEGGDVRIQYDIIIRVCDALSLRSGETHPVSTETTVTTNQEQEILEALRTGNVPAALEQIAALLRNQE